MWRDSAEIPVEHCTTDGVDEYGSMSPFHAAFHRQHTFSCRKRSSQWSRPIDGRRLDLDLDSNVSLLSSASGSLGIGSSEWLGLKIRGSAPVI